MAIHIYSYRELTTHKGVVSANQYCNGVSSNKPVPCLMMPCTISLHDRDTALSNSIFIKITSSLLVLSHALSITQPGAAIKTYVI